MIRHGIAVILAMFLAGCGNSTPRCPKEQPKNGTPCSFLMNDPTCYYPDWFSMCSDTSCPIGEGVACECFKEERWNCYPVSPYDDFGMDASLPADTPEVIEPIEDVLDVIVATETGDLPIVDTPVAQDTTGGDTTLEIPPCNGVPNNAPCDTKGAECADTSPWCGSMMAYHMCHCNGTEWQCYSAAAPVDCHECCQEAMGGMYFCSDGQCLKASGCLALECCVPGPQGDAWCKGTFGECSKCTVVSNDGRCIPVDCGG